MGLEGRGLTAIADGRRLLERVDIAAPPGMVTVIVGPNGAGKSTLLKLLAGDRSPQSGAVYLNGRPLGAWSPRERALQRAVLPQTPDLAADFRASEVVAFGRYPHRRRAGGEEDRDAVLGAMDAAEVAALAGRACLTLSGGEMHRTHFARALAQIWAPLPGGRARMLLLDEPTASLDLFHQHAILAKARALSRAGAGVLAVLHDLNLAAAYADRIVVLADGRIDAAGPPGAVLTAERITRVWRVACDVVRARNGTVHVIVEPRAPVEPERPSSNLPYPAPSEHADAGAGAELSRFDVRYGSACDMAPHRRSEG
jgi:iron complex transport system ATP-binding protein